MIGRGEAFEGGPSESTETGVSEIGVEQEDGKKDRALQPWQP